MRTKTLLIAVAALAAGILVSSAQTYSQNVVGYYNVPIPANSFYIVANQFNVGVSNGLNEMFASGLMSDVNGVSNSVVYLWQPPVYVSYQYFSAADAAADSYVGGAGFYDGSGNYITTIVPPGTGVFLQNLAPGSITATVIGSVSQGTNNITMGGSAAGAFTLVGSPIPVSTNVASAPISFAGTSDVNGTYNDVIFLFNGAWISYQYFSAADAAADSYVGGAGFYDGSGNYQTTTVSPTVGTGFYIQHYGPNGDGTTETWTNIFTVPQ